MFVEIIGRRGTVESIVRVDSLPVTVGRAYTNDVILGDKFVCPDHFRVILDENGDLVAEDLGSVNGIYEGRKLRRSSWIKLGPDTLVRAGHTTLRFRWRDHEVPPAAAESSGARKLLRPFSNSAAALGVFLLGIAVLLGDWFFGSYSGFEFSDMLENVSLMVVVFALWAGFWAFVNRIVSHSFRFLQHLALTSAVVIAMIVIYVVFEYFTFLLSPVGSFAIVEVAGYAVLFAVLLFGHFSIITPSYVVKRVVASVLITAGIFGTFGLEGYLEESDFSTKMDYSRTLKPVDKKWLRKVASEEFFSGLVDLKKEIDGMASEKRREKEEKNKRKRVADQPG